MRTRRLLVLAAIAALTVGYAASTAQAAPGPKTLQTFGNGTVTAGVDSATIVNAQGQYGGVYISSKSQSSKPLNQVVFQFRNNGGDVTAGSPRFSLPIDTDNKGKTNDGYAFISVSTCGGVSGDNTLVSTQAPGCGVNFQGVDYANWSTFAAANPTYRTAPGYIPFIIADDPGSFAVDSIVLR